MSFIKLVTQETILCFLVSFPDCVFEKYSSLFSECDSNTKRIIYKFYGIPFDHENGDIPVCNISLEWPKNPVVLNHLLYNKPDLDQWLNQKLTCPITHTPVKKTDVKEPSFHYLYQHVNPSLLPETFDNHIELPKDLAQFVNEKTQFFPYLLNQCLRTPSSFYIIKQTMCSLGAPLQIDPEKVPCMEICYHIINHSHQFVTSKLPNLTPFDIIHSRLINILQSESDWKNNDQITILSQMFQKLIKHPEAERFNPMNSLFKRLLDCFDGYFLHFCCGGFPNLIQFGFRLFPGNHLFFYLTAISNLTSVSELQKAFLDSPKFSDTTNMQLLFQYLATTECSYFYKDQLIFVDLYKLHVDFELTTGGRKYEKKNFFQTEIIHVVTKKTLLKLSDVKFFRPLDSDVVELLDHDEKVIAYTFRNSVWLWFIQNVLTKGPYLKCDSSVLYDLAVYIPYPNQLILNKPIIYDLVILNNQEFHRIDSVNFQQLPKDLINSCSFHFDDLTMFPLKKLLKYDTTWVSTFFFVTNQKERSIFFIVPTNETNQNDFRCLFNLLFDDDDQ